MAAHEPPEGVALLPLLMNEAARAGWIEEVNDRRWIDPARDARYGGAVDWMEGAPAEPNIAPPPLTEDEKADLWPHLCGRVRGDLNVLGTSMPVSEPMGRPAVASQRGRRFHEQRRLAGLTRR